MDGFTISWCLILLDDTIFVSKQAKLHWPHVSDQLGDLLWQANQMCCTLLNELFGGLKVDAGWVQIVECVTLDRGDQHALGDLQVFAIFENSISKFLHLLDLLFTVRVEESYDISINHEVFPVRFAPVEKGSRLTSLEPKAASIVQDRLSLNIIVHKSWLDA